jgi:Flp pilus assembly protein TadD
MATLSALLGNGREAAFEIAQALETEPQNNMVRRNAVITYEILGDRENALKALANATRSLLMDMSRHPDLRNLGLDPRFRDMIAGTPNR